MFFGVIERHGRWLIPLGLALVTAAAFLPTLDNGFTNWDDPKTLADNPYYRGLGSTQLHWMWTTFLMGHYIPLTWMTFGLDYIFWGMNPAGYHFTSLVLHVANAVLFYLVAARLLQLAAPEDAALRLGAGLAAVLFAVHPQRVESVAWATERRDVLCGLFFLLAVLAYLRAVQVSDVTRRRRWRAASLGAFTAALLSKASAMPLPAVLLLLDLYPLRRLGVVGWRRLLLEKAPYGVLGGAGALLGLITVTKSGAMAPGEEVWSRVAIAGYSLVFYPWKFLWPVGLSPLYPLPRQSDVALWAFAFPTLAFVAGTVGLVALRRRWPAALAAWTYSALMILPVSGLVMRAGPQLVADRYSYLSGLAWALLSGGALRHYCLARNWPARTGPGAAVLTGLLVVVIAVLGILTWRQVQVWRDPETLWTHAISTAPSSTAYFNLGAFLENAGRRQEAAEQYRQAIAVNPGLAEAHGRLGLVLARQGEIPEAIFHLREDVRLDPGSSQAHKDLGTVLGRHGRFVEAVEHLRQAAQISPTDAEAHNNLGNALAFLGRLDDAIRHYQEALKLIPDSPEAYNNLGVALAKQGRHSEAVEHFRRALSGRPGFPEAQKNLERALVASSPAR